MTSWRITADYPQLWLLAFVAAIWTVARILPLGADMLAPVGWLLVLAGLGLMIWTPVYFRRARTTINPHGQPQSLITGGPFRLSRNPIYLADVILLIGLCLAWRALPGLILVPGFIWLINQRFIRAEEARLTAAFPADYPVYQARVRRWL